MSLRIEMSIQIFVHILETEIEHCSYSTDMRNESSLSLGQRDDYLVNSITEWCLFPCLINDTKTTYEHVKYAIYQTTNIIT
jgi:hypothetical protein